jgi:hypothetical protein
MKHENTGFCPKCLDIFNQYTVNENIKGWFITLQREHPQVHISCCGRNKKDQYDAFMRGASRAKWGQSAHNYGCAVDVFFNTGGDIYPKDQFEAVLAPALLPWLRWYGAPGAVFSELPHVEIANWVELVKHGAAALVEPLPPTQPPA